MIVVQFGFHNATLRARARAMTMKVRKLGAELTAGTGVALMTFGLLLASARLALAAHGACPNPLGSACDVIYPEECGGACGTPNCYCNLYGSEENWICACIH